MHSSRMRTVRSSSRLSRGVYLSACWDTPRDHARQGTPRDQAAPRLGTPRNTHPPGTRHPPPRAQTDTCKNINNLRNFVTDGKHDDHGKQPRSMYNPKQNITIPNACKLSMGGP